MRSVWATNSDCKKSNSEEKEINREQIQPQQNMCIRNGIEYSCPDGHILLNTIRPFTLCSRASRGPIPRQCDDVVDRIRPSDEWCIDCWMREVEVRRAVARGISGKGRCSKYGAGSR